MDRHLGVNGSSARESTHLLAGGGQQQQARGSISALAASIASGPPSSASSAAAAYPPRHGPTPSAAHTALLSRAAEIVGKTVPTHFHGGKESDTDGYEVSDSEMEDSVVLKDGRRFPTALKEKHVSLGQLLAIVYFCVANGPYGLEDAILAGGVTWVCILLVVLPLTVNLPIGLLTSELASAMPQNGGYIIWVSRSFGNFWGFLEGWWSWSSGLFDTALYPFLIVAYFNDFLVTFCSVSLPYWTLYGMRVSLCFIVMVLNLLNVQMQGTISLIFAFLCLAPFALLTVVGFGDINWPNVVLGLRNVSQVNWGLTLSVIMWVGSGWDSPGTVAGDVKTPKKTYPRAVILAVVLVMLTNLLPVMVAFSVEKRYETYVSGNAFWATVAYKIGGYWLQVLVILVAIFGNLNLLHVLLTSSSWSLYALALPGLLDVPLLTRLQGSLRTPWVCIVINTAGIMACCLYTFAELVQVTMTLNGLALILQCMALVWLRIAEPKMKRPYRIPASTGGVALFMLMPMAVSLLLLVSIDRTPQYICLLFTVLGCALFLLSRLIERVSQTDSGVKPETVDLQDVFEDVVDNVQNSKPDDFIPDLGFRSSLLTQQLPESIRSDPTEVNDNVGDDDDEDRRIVRSDDDDLSDIDESAEERKARQQPIEPEAGYGATTDLEAVQE